MKIIETVRVNEKNTREVNTKDGAKKVLSFKAYPFDDYIGGIWLPANTNYGDIVTVYVDQIKKEERDGKTYYNANFAKVTPEFNLNRDNQAPQAPQADLFGGQQPMNVSDADLPF